MRLEWLRATCIIIITERQNARHFRFLDHFRYLFAVHLSCNILIQNVRKREVIRNPWHQRGFGEVDVKSPREYPLQYESLSSKRL